MFSQICLCRIISSLDILNVKLTFPEEDHIFGLPPSRHHYYTEPCGRCLALEQKKLPLEVSHPIAMSPTLPHLTIANLHFVVKHIH